MICFFFKRASASNMAMLGIYVKFQGGMMYLYRHYEIAYYAIILGPYIGQPV